MELERKVIKEEQKREDTVLEDRSFAYNIAFGEERRFTKEEYAGIMEGAEFLREFEARKGKMSGDIISRLSKEEKDVPLSRVYALAQDLGIDRKYVDRYLEMRFPSEEQKLKDLKKIGAKAGWDIFLGNYETQLELALTKAFPNERFFPKRNTYDSLGFYIIEKIKKRGIFFKKNKIVEEGRMLANLVFNNDLSNIDLYDPCFLRACGETFIKLNQAFNKEWKVIYYYNVNLFK